MSCGELNAPISCDHLGGEGFIHLLLINQKRVRRELGREGRDEGAAKKNEMEIGEK